MSAQAEFRAALANGDVAMLQKVHGIVFPHLPQPANFEQAEVAMHMARTQSGWLNHRARCYSHAWLIERGLPSGLPDDLKPKAQRLYPKIAEAVFVSVNSRSPALKPIARMAQQAACDAVEDCYANGDTDPELVRSRMMDARARTFQQLLGTTLGGTHG